MRVPAVLMVLGLLTCLSTACSGSTRTGTSTPTTDIATPSEPTSLGSPAASASAVVSERPVGDSPPAASLAAEGGDLVAGQLGTYTWRDGGSDSPWLQGAPIRVGSGEPLSMSVDPPIEIASWQARSVPARAAGPEGATPLGDGSGAPSFAAPGAGAWTVEVHVVFGGDLGSASYFWRLDVSG